jgi:hypothetical protein
VWQLRLLQSDYDVFAAALPHCSSEWSAGPDRRWILEAVEQFCLDKFANPYKRLSVAAETAERQPGLA